MHVLGDRAQASQQRRVVYQIPQKPIRVGAEGKCVRHDVVDKFEKPLEGLLLIEWDLVVHCMRVELGFHSMSGSNELLGAGNRVDDEVGDAVKPSGIAEHCECTIEPVDNGIQEGQHHAVVAGGSLGSNAECLDHDLQQPSRGHFLADARGHRHLQGQGEQAGSPVVKVGHFPIIRLGGVVLHACHGLPNDVQKHTVINVCVQRCDHLGILGWHDGDGLQCCKRNGLQFEGCVRGPIGRGMNQLGKLVH